MSKSRVLLVGGPPGARKTTLGRAVAARINCPSLTVDDIHVAVKAMTTAETHPALHNPMRHLQYFTEVPKEQLVSDAIALQDALWPAVQNVVRVHATVKESIVIDWWLLSPGKVAALGFENVESIWLHIDADALEARERNNNPDYWAESDHPEKMLNNFMHRSRWCNERVSTQARKLGLPVIRLQGDRPVNELVKETLRLVGWDDVKNRSL